MVQPKLLQLMSLVRITAHPLRIMPKTGMIMPILGAKPGSRGSLADALLTKTQQRVLRVLLASLNEASTRPS